jgi:hypothetical protein
VVGGEDEEKHRGIVGCNNTFHQIGHLELLRKCMQVAVCCFNLPISAATVLKRRTRGLETSFSLVGSCADSGAASAVAAEAPTIYSSEGMRKREDEH